MHGVVDRRAFLAAVGAASLAGCMGSPGASAGGATADDGGGEPALPTTDSLPLPLPPAEITERSVSGGPAG